MVFCYLKIKCLEWGFFVNEFSWEAIFEIIYGRIFEFLMADLLFCFVLQKLNFPFFETLSGINLPLKTFSSNIQFIFDNFCSQEFYSIRFSKIDFIRFFRTFIFQKFTAEEDQTNWEEGHGERDGREVLRSLLDRVPSWRAQVSGNVRLG